MMDLAKKPYEKIKLVEINPHLSCYLCKGYYVDATTISECLHSFCRSCIIKFLHEHSYCPICEVIINKAKPNLKLDKTLQDIVYKLVPELFLNEMKRRQRFYQNHPDLATKVTPEERGVDTERTIFNPRDTISLSIEYISDDSTPGAILIPQLIGKGVDINNRNKSQVADNEENSAIKRFLQCPGMCRVEVLKKFIRNKYNVDTNQYYIDILYKRVPLPDHYTLIDVAYIYSWKRNEPLKFFFKITDINLVTDTFDYLIPPQLENPPLKSVEKKSVRSVLRSDSKHEVKTRKNNENVQKPASKKDKESDINKKNIEKTKQELTNNLTLNEEKKVLEGLRKNEKKQEYTNITLDRSNNVEIITKIQKVSNKNGLQIGIKITKQTVKKSVSPKLNGDKTTSDDDDNKSLVTPIKPNSPNIPDIDPEKSNFLKSIELTAKNVIQAMSPQKLDLPKVEPKGTKRKNASPVKTDKPAKKPKRYVNIQPKSVQNPTVWQMMSNVSQNVSNMSKIVEQMTPNASCSNTSDLQALLFDSYKINIPASLSVTVKNEKDGPTSSPFQRPVQNYIEILKIPDRPATPARAADCRTENPKLGVLDRLNSSVEVSRIEVKIEEPKAEPGDTNQEDEVPIESGNIKQEPNETSLEQVSGVSKSPTVKTVPQPKTTPTCLPSPAYLPCKVTNMPTRDNFVKLNPRTPQTFQKMFEEAIKKPEFSTKFQTVPISKNDVSPNKPTQKNALNLATSDTTTTTTTIGKRNILEIASKLYKRTKMEQEKGATVSSDEPKSEIHDTPKALSKPLNIPRLSLQRKPKFHVKGNPPLKDFNSYISSKPPQPQTVTSLHSPTLGLNYTVSVTQANPASPPTVLSKNSFRSESPKQALEVDTRNCSPKQSLLSPRHVSPKVPQPEPLNIPRKYSVSPKLKPLSPQLSTPKEIPTASPVSKSTPPVSKSTPPVSKSTPPTSKLTPPTSKLTPPTSKSLLSISKAASPSRKGGTSPTRKLSSPGAPKANLNVVTSSQGENNQPLSPNQILEKYNIQNLAQLTANFNFPPNLCMSPTANQLAAIHQAMIYRHFEMQNHQNWLNMNPGPLMQYEKYLQSLSKS